MARSSGDQINQLTSYLDASNVYGSTKEDQDALRLGRKGKLKYTNLHIRKPLLPALDPNTAEEECRISTRNLHCFAAGDRRCNEQPGLTAIHTVFLREHNRSVHCLNFFMLPFCGPSRVLNLASHIATRTSKIQGRRKLGCARQAGPRISIRTTDSNLAFGIAENPLFTMNLD